MIIFGKFCNSFPPLFSSVVRRDFLANGFIRSSPKNICFTQGEADVQYNIAVINLNLIKGNLSYRMLTKQWSLLSLDLVGLNYQARHKKSSYIHIWYVWLKKGYSVF